MMLGILIIDHLDDHSRPTIWFKKGQTDLRDEQEIMSAIAEALDGIARTDDYRMGFLRWDAMTAEGFTTKVDIGDVDELAVIEVWHEYVYADSIWMMNTAIRMNKERLNHGIVGRAYRCPRPSTSTSVSSMRARS